MATEITLQGTLVNTEKGAEGGRIAYAKQIYDETANVDLASVNRVLGADQDWGVDEFVDGALNGETLIQKILSTQSAVGDLSFALTDLKQGSDLQGVYADDVWINSVHDGIVFTLDCVEYGAVLFTKQARKVEYGGNTLLVVEQMAYVYDINDGNAFKGLFFRVNRQNGNDKTYGQWVRIDNQGANNYTDNLIGDLAIDLHDNLKGTEVTDVVTALNKLDDKRFADIYQSANQLTSLSDVTNKLYGNEKNELDNALNVFGDNKHVFGILNEEKNSVETFFANNFSTETDKTIGNALQKIKDSIPTSTGGEGGQSTPNINIKQTTEYTDETEAQNSVVSQKAIADALAQKADVSALNDLEMIQVTDSNNFAVVDEQGNAILSVENGFVKTKDFDSEIYAEKQRMMIEAMSYHGKWVFWTNGEVTFNNEVKQAGKYVFDSCPTIDINGIANITKVIMGNGAVKSLGTTQAITMQCTEVNTYGFNGMGSTSFYALFASMPIKRLYLNHWDTSECTSFNCLFYSCSELQSLDLSSFNTSNVTNMYCLFYRCYKLQSVDLSSFDTTNVTNMQSMFYNCTSLTSLDLSNFDTSSVTNMQYMFYNCTSLTSLDISNFDTSKVTTMQSMFYNCTSLTSLDLSNFDTSSVTNMQYMFYNCTSLTSLDISNFDTSNVTNMQYMFYNCTSLTSLDISNFDTSSVTNMQAMFYNCTSLTSLDVSNFDTSNVTNMDNMFQNCTSLTSLDISNFDTSKVTTMQSVFYGCRNITSFKVSENFFKANLSEFDFSRLIAWKNTEEIMQMANALPQLAEGVTKTIKVPSAWNSSIGSTIQSFAQTAEGKGWTVSLV